MAHEKVFGICENKCQVPVYPKEALEPYVSDTGWVTINVSAGDYTEVIVPIQVRKIGKVVYVRGTINANYNFELGLPSEFKPANQVKQVLGFSKDMNSEVYAEISFEGFFFVKGWAIADTNYTVNINFSYVVD